MEMNDATLPLICEGSADELWHLRFDAPVAGVLTPCWQENRSRAAVERFLVAWRAGEGYAIFCGRCPELDTVRCSHPEAYVWEYREIVNVRAMPMREAI